MSLRQQILRSCAYFYRLLDAYTITFRFPTYRRGEKWNKLETRVIAIQSLALAVLLLAVILMYVRIRRQMKKKRQNIKPNEVMQWMGKVI